VVKIQLSILLPPSEAKSRGGRGKPLLNRRRGLPIDSLRDQAFAALQEILGDGGQAARALLLPPSVAEDALADNQRILSNPTRPAVERYSGVLYQGLAVAELSPAARTAASKNVLVFSGLFGVLRGGDAVPAYRVPAKAVLGQLGIASSFWRRHLPSLLPPLLGAGLVVDLRSGDYASMWQPARTDPIADRMLRVSVLSEKLTGGLGVLSYASKLGKGKLTAALLERCAAGHPVLSASDVASAWLSIGGQSAREHQAKTGTAIDLIT
jgi:cytoplasmic iron level regulating protein YaaA (DUF328/UPF0246 family)